MPNNSSILVQENPFKGVTKSQTPLKMIKQEQQSYPSALRLTKKRVFPQIPPCMAIVESRTILNCSI